MRVTLIAVGMCTKVMYCFSCYLVLYLEKYLQYSIDITTEQSFRYVELIDAKIWVSKNAPLCRVFANRVTFIHTKAWLLYTYELKYVYAG